MLMLGFQCEYYLETHTGSDFEHEARVDFERLKPD